MAKLPWYMKSINKGSKIEFHWVWCLYQLLKFEIIKWQSKIKSS